MQFFKNKLKTIDFLLLLIICGVVFLIFNNFSLNYNWHFKKALAVVFTNSDNNNIPYFFSGLFTTIRLSIWGLILATFIAILLVIPQCFNCRYLNLIIRSYILLIRNIPALVFIFICYYFIFNQLIPALGFTDYIDNGKPGNWLQNFLFGPKDLWENLLSGIIAIAMISSAYIAEILRAGIDNVDKGQWEAARSLGLSEIIILKQIIFPQALRTLLPALAGQFISLVKDSSIVSLISIQELTFVGSEIANSTGYIFEIWILIGFSYFILCFALARIFQHLELKAN